MRQGLTGRRDVSEGYSTDGTRTLVAYDAVDDSVGWAIAIKAPIAEILKETNAASITIISVVIISIFMVSMFLVSHRARNPIPEAMVAIESSQPARKNTHPRRATRKDTS
jgi:hypothetical protein